MLLALTLAALALGGQQASPATAMLGRSWEGRPIHVARVGDPDAARRVLVVGCIHGDECAGLAVTGRLLRARGAADLWVLPNLNPDGYARRSRWNARGVDLNRDFDTSPSARAGSHGT